MFASSSLHRIYSLTVFDVFDKTKTASKKFKNSVNNYNIVKLHISILEAVTDISVCLGLDFYLDQGAVWRLLMKSSSKTIHCIM